MNFQFNNVELLGISSIVPSKELSLLDDENLYNGDKVRIERVINSSGFLKRRVCDKDVLSSDLCYVAAEDLIDALNIDRARIDALLFISYTPDYLMPATSYVLHKRLALSQECIVMDIPQACSGYVLGLFQASMLINAGCKNVLLLVGDTFSKFSDMFIDNTAPIFGDAGSATLIKQNENASKIYFTINSDGTNYDAFMCKNGGFRNVPAKDAFYENEDFRYEAKMDGGKIFEFTMQEIAPSINALIEFSKMDRQKIDWFVMHQANKFILENIARQLDIDIEKMPMDTLTKYGNQCGASIPCTITDMLKEEVSSSKTTLLLSGFGIGLSWANCIIECNKIYCSFKVLA